MDEDHGLLRAMSSDPPAPIVRHASSGGGRETDSTLVVALAERAKLWKAASLYWAVLRRLRLLHPKRSATADLRTAAGAGTWSAIEQHRSPLVRSGRYDVVCFAIIDWDFRIQRRSRS